MMLSEIPVGRDTVVTLSYRVYDDQGDLLDGSAEDSPLLYVHGHGQVVVGLENGLEGLRRGESRSIVVPPELAYGAYDPEGVVEIERSDFPSSASLAVGDEFIAQSPDGEELPLTILDVREDAVIVDTNHPLAGETLRFEVTVLDVRAATGAEIARARESDDDDDGRLLTLKRKTHDTDLLS